MRVDQDWFASRGYVQTSWPLPPPLFSSGMSAGNIADSSAITSTTSSSTTSTTYTTSTASVTRTISTRFASSSSSSFPTILTEPPSTYSSTLSGNLYTVSAGNRPVIATLQTSDITYCAPATVSWEGGNGPWTIRLAAVDSDQSWLSPPNWVSNSTTSQHSITVFNNIAPKYLLVDITDYYNTSFSKALPVSGANGPCLVGNGSVADSSTSSTGWKSPLTPGAVAGIVLGCIVGVAILCPLLWRWILASRRPRPPRALVVPYEQRDLAGDRRSVRSGQTSRWSTFTGQTAAQPGNALHTDIQGMEEGRTPISAPTMKRAKGQATQPPVWASLQSLPTPSAPESETPSASDELDQLGPGTEMTESSPSMIRDRSSIYDQTHSGTGSMRSPFDDDQSAVTLSVGQNPDEKTATPLKAMWPPRERLADAIAAIRNGDHSPLSAQPANGGEASPLSTRDLETLADLVAARLTQRAGSSTGRTRSSNGSELPPRYS